MDFFEAQDAARRRTKWLVLYFVLAVAGVVAAVYFLATLVLMFLVDKPGEVSLWNPGLLLPVAGGTLALVLGGSAFKSMQLKGGGSVVASDLGGRLVDPGTTDHRERQLLNVVQEMAIASGVPVPEVYVMDEELGINAFAAGTDPSNAVIGVTRGCIDQLTRAELQGVIAHEFSHILNGDMRINMRLIGMIFGILIIMIIGRTILYSLRHMRFSSRNKEGGAGILVVVVLGVGLLAIGWIGMIFARLIQAAVSRQREYLADASAVQFTREPEGIAGALKKIGGRHGGSRIAHPKGMEASHMFFSDGGMFSWGFRTHPPLPVRIRAIEASWDGKMVDPGLRPVEVRAEHAARKSTPPPLRPDFMGGMAALAAVDHLGDSTRLRAKIGQKVREGLDARWVAATQTRDEAQTLVFALLLAEDDALRSGELEFLRKAAGDSAVEAGERWQKDLQELHSTSKIALVDLCIPTLRRMSQPEYERFVEVTKWLIASDTEVDLFEYMLQHIIARHLATHFEKRGFPRIRHRRMSDLGEEANVLCSAVARLDRDGPAAAVAFQSVREEWGKSERWEPRLVDPGQCGPEDLDRALVEFEASTPIMKKQILLVCGLVAAEDGILSNREAELLRTIADAIGAGLPPIVLDLEEG